MVFLESCHHICLSLYLLRLIGVKAEKSGILVATHTLSIPENFPICRSRLEFKLESVSLFGDQMIGHYNKVYLDLIECGYKILHTQMYVMVDSHFNLQGKIKHLRWDLAKTIKELSQTRRKRSYDDDENGELPLAKLVCHQSIPSSSLW